MEVLSNGDFESLSTSEKREYIQNLNEYSKNYDHKQFQFGQKVIKSVYPLLRSYQIIIEGAENVPKDSNVIFLTNHSNSHDIFTGYEMMSMLSRRGSVMVATDCLNPLTIGLFNTANATLFDRRNKEQSQNSMFEMSKKIINGNDGLMVYANTILSSPEISTTLVVVLSFSLCFEILKCLSAKPATWAE